MSIERDPTPAALPSLAANVSPVAAPLVLPAWLPFTVTLGYCVLLTIAELLTTFVDPMLGLVLHMLILLGLLGLTARWWQHPLHRFLLALVAGPLIRIMSLSLPLAGLPFISWLLITSIPLFAAAFVTMQTLQLSRHDVGLTVRPTRRAWRTEGWIAFTGIPLGFLEYVILQPPPLVAGLDLQTTWFPIVVIFISTGLMEELVFRGVMQHTALPVLSRWAIPIVALVFAILHIGYQSWVDFGFVLGVGLLYGYLVQRTGSILGVTISHGLINSMLFVILPVVFQGR